MLTSMPGQAPSAPRAGVGARLPAGQRAYVVGDVHGHLDKLRGIHARIRTDLRDRPVASPLLIHLGDLIDRGPASAGCVALLAAGSPIAGVPAITLMGNHEWMMLAAIEDRDHDDVDRWLDNGGAATLTSWGLKSTSTPRDWLAAIPARQLVFLRDLPKTHALGGYLFVHAGVRPGVTLRKQREIDLLWIRERFLEWEGAMLPEAPQQIIVHGHTPTEAPVLKPNRIGLDTGAGKGGPLTCVVLEGDEVRHFGI